MISAARMLGLDAKLTDWSRSTTCAADGDEITTVSTWPSRRYITGPCFLAKSRSATCGSRVRRWRRLPMKGRHRGPGGRLFLELGADLR